MAGGKYRVMTIAKWYAAWAEANEADLSNLKLQKILYYAQGHHLGETGEPLFNEPIFAWAHGPVIPDVYHEFKHFGSGDIALSDSDPFDWDEVDEDTTDYLIRIWDAYGGFGAWRLRNMTHNEAPWREAFDPDGRNIVIPPERIQRHFADN